mmetsp:Transcript_9101/g.17103  ORF Transcript_9101/g.17103 Transcript_9101/m.17103 type:complete len:118 (-) Transcript_9101:208-561(-)
MGNDSCAVNVHAPWGLHLIQRASDLERLAQQLALEEGIELKRGSDLNIMGLSQPNGCFMQSLDSAGDEIKVAPSQPASQDVGGVASKGVLPEDAIHGGQKESQIVEAPGNEYRVGGR